MNKEINGVAIVRDHEAILHIDIEEYDALCCSIARSLAKRNKGHKISVALRADKTRKDDDFLIEIRTRRYSDGASMGHRVCLGRNMFEKVCSNTGGTADTIASNILQEIERENER